MLRGKGASTANLQYLAFTFILLVLLIYIRHTGKKRDICLHPTLFLSRMRAVTWRTKLKNSRYACKHRSVNHEEIAECFTSFSSEKTMFLNYKLNHETIRFTAQEVLVTTLYRNCVNNSSIIA